ncbi:hypothetical protein A2856_03045 [Candidatus Uhrbacteria bacterium RIFCSPHIGHO2_01_FULL_63_20]|uniref:Uncharacterized protein n=1 Tax=Candidatus Uhrbacteria bacterium RIFCSPHIGHO2_01_FULL_63_20 TaxID=1802385 RepID=A0A1F7TL51_9BACT|nr:MAG: hypothetical protein A2856_03045 [Candidatus Uhrbacteria bacterium RIFCSPHIGHO2_01_FULL_63_20]
MLTEELRVCPIVLVKEPPGMNAAIIVADVLSRFPKQAAPVLAVSTRSPTDPDDAYIYKFCDEILVDALELAGMFAARTTRDGHPYGFDRVSVNETVCGDGGRIGIAIGDDAIEAALREAEYDVRAYKVPTDDELVEWLADRLAEFVYGVIDPDDGGLDRCQGVDMAGFAEDAPA